VAAKIVRQPNKIALLGAPTSAAATAPGREGAPQALRSAGLVGRLQSAGYEVIDLGDDPPQIFQPDDQSPRARNLVRVLASLEALKPRVEIATKSGALPLILSGDGSAALATVAGIRRYFRHVGIVLMDRDAGLHTPATTTTGSVDGMLVSHLAGRGAAELVRFWPEPPLVREPDLAVFGVERIDQGEDEALRRSPVRQYLAADVKRVGAAAAAKSAVERIHASGHDFVLHVDVDVIADFQATDRPGSGGLSFEDVRAAAEVFAKQKHLAAIEVSGYDPTKDSDGSGAKLILDLIAGVLATRLEALKEAAEDAVPAAAPAPVVEQKKPSEDQTVAEEPEPKVEPEEEVPHPAVVPGEAWSSGPDEETEPSVETHAAESGAEAPETSEDADQSHS
jgi:arginase